MGLYTERCTGGRAKQDLWSVSEGEDTYWCFGVNVYTAEEHTAIAHEAIENARKAAHAAFRKACDEMTKYVGKDCTDFIKSHMVDFIKSHMVYDALDADDAPKLQAV